MIDKKLVKAIEKVASIATPVFSKEKWTWGGKMPPTQCAIEEHLLGQCIAFIKDEQVSAVECGHLRIEKDKEFSSLTFYLNLGSFYND